MRIYVVTEGDYSDYHICGVAIDINIAKMIAKLHSDKTHTANIETYNTDEYTGNEKKQWFVKFYRKDPPEAYSKYFDFKITRKLPYVEKGRAYSEVEYVVYVQADDEAHALKIAEDTLAKYKAELAGI